MEGMCSSTCDVPKHGERVFYLPECTMLPFSFLTDANT